MRKHIITLIVAFAFIALGLVCLLIFAISQDNGSFSFKHNNALLVNTQSIDLDDINTINITYHSEDVMFYESDTDELILKEYMNSTPDSNELAQISKNTHDLSINSGKRKTRLFTFELMTSNNRVEIYLPKEYNEKLIVTTSSGNIISELTLNLSEFEASISSGDIKMNQVYADSISASSSSGNITFQTAEGNRKLLSSSGDIKVFRGSGDSEVATTSGAITIENADGYYQVVASSGDIKIFDAVGGGEFKSTSGYIKLDFLEVTENLEINTSSGDISLIIPGSTNFDFSANSSSGDIKTFFNNKLSFNEKGNEAFGSVGDNANVSIDTETSSGYIKINKK